MFLTPSPLNCIKLNKRNYEINITVALLQVELAVVTEEKKVYGSILNLLAMELKICILSGHSC